MRLLIIIVLGSILIGLTYMWTSSNNTAQINEADWASPLPPRQRKKIQTTTPGSQTEKVAQADAPENLKQEIKATTAQEALLKAKINAGMKDPFAPIAPALENTSNTNLGKTPGKSKTKEAVSSSNIPPGMVPPPPPNSLSLEELKNMPGLAKTPGSLASGLNISELPLPPRDQSVANKLRLTGIVGDRAFFTVVDRLTARANHWPTEFSLKPGNAFHSVYLKAINEHSATLEEDGEEYLRTLPSIR